MLLINLTGIFEPYCSVCRAAIKFSAITPTRCNNDTKKLSVRVWVRRSVRVSPFEVHFYLVGILFIIFDLEIIFLYP
jgi:NADH:ubiquinone oxidoreductase subunit 3 (subunit A)